MVCAFGTRGQFYPRPRGEVWSIPGWDVNGLDPGPRTMHPPGAPPPGVVPTLTCGIPVASPCPDRRNFFAWRPLPDAPGTAHTPGDEEARELPSARLLAYTKAPATTFRTFSSPAVRFPGDGERQGPGAAQEPCRFPVFRRDFSRPSGQRCAGRDEAVLRGGRTPVTHPYRKEASRPRTASSSPARDGHGWTCLARWLSRSPRAGPHRVRAADTDYVWVDRPAEYDRVANGRAGESGNL